MSRTNWVVVNFNSNNKLHSVTYDRIVVIQQLVSVLCNKKCDDVIVSINSVKK